VTASVLTLVGGLLAPSITLEDEIASRPHARLFRGVDHVSNQPVVVKVFFDGPIVTGDALRFTREIEIASQLIHPGVVPLLRWGREGRFIYFVMPLMAGGSLRDLLDREGPLSLARTRAIAHDVAAALRYAHDRNVVHRDIKPGNILLDAEGRAYIADLGIARLIERSPDTAGITSTGVSVGTPAYMSPEQAAADRRIDGRTDQYALACVIFEMLTGAPPFTGASPQDVLARQLREAPPSVRVVRPELPATVDQAIIRALAKTRAERFAQVDELAAALEQGGNGPVDGAWFARAITRVRRTPRVLLLAAVAFVAGVVAASRLWGTTSPTLDPARVAVLEFVDLTPSGELRHLTRRLGDNLASQLGETRVLQVVSPNAVRALTDQHVSVDSLVRALRPGSLIEGTVDRSADRIRVDVRLVDAQSRVQLASARIERPQAELFQLLDEIAQRVSTLLKPRIGAEVAIRASAGATASATALDLTYRGEQQFEDALAADSGGAAQAAQTLAALRRADSLFAQAGREDPAWGEPRVRRAWVLVEEARRSSGTSEQRAFERALAQADDVLRQSPSSPSARELRGAVHFWMVTRGAAPQGSSAQVMELARQELTAATAGGESRPAAWGLLSLVLSTQGRAEEADRAAQRAFELDEYQRDGPLIVFSLFARAIERADFARARAWCERGARDYPLHKWFVECQLTLLAEDAGRRADPALATALVARANLLDPPAKAIGAGRAYSVAYRDMMLAVVWARAGRLDSARAAAARAKLLTLQDTTVAVDYLYDLAFVQVVLGDSTAAATTLREFARRRPAMAGLLREHARWSALRPRLDARPPASDRPSLTDNTAPGGPANRR
jgi:serine/threonine protein kinase/tetratricopeptide (TPR) repeat protein